MDNNGISARSGATGGAAAAGAGRREGLVRAAFRRNATAIIALDTIWDLGAPCIATAVIVPEYLLHFGASKTLVQVVMVGLWLTMILQVASGKLFHGPRRRVSLFLLWVGYCACWLGFGLAGWLGKGLLPAKAWAGVFVAFCLATAGLVAIGAPAYTELVLDATPLLRRGWLASMRILFGGLFGVAGSLMADRLLHGLPAPVNFHLCFTVGSAFMLVSCVSILVMRDHGASADRHAPRPRIRSSALALLREPRFRVFLLVYAVGMAVMALVPLLIAYGRDILHMPSEQAGRFLVASFVGVAVIGWAVPLLADRFGFRLIAVIQAAFMLAASACPLLAGGNEWALLAGYALFAAAGSVGPSILANLGPELAPAVKPAMVISLTTVLGGPLSVVLAPLAGRMADRYHEGGYRVVFATAAALSLLLLVGYARWVREPRANNCKL